MNRLALLNMLFSYALCYVDDVLLLLTHQVFERFRQANLRFNPAKSKFVMSEVTCLDHRLSEHGVSSTDDWGKRLRTDWWRLHSFYIGPWSQKPRPRRVGYIETPWWRARNRQLDWRHVKWLLVPFAWFSDSAKMQIIYLLDHYLWRTMCSSSHSFHKAEDRSTMS